MNKVAKSSRTLIGKIVSSAGANTVVVTVDRTEKDPLYGKYLRRTTKLHVHDTENKAQKGDVVRIKECRPVSKTKNWILVEIIEKAIH